MSVHRHLLQNAKSPAFPPGTFPAAPGHLSVPACLQIPLRRKGTQPPLRSVLSKCFVSSSSPRISLIDSPEVQRESQYTLTLMLWMCRSPYQVARATLLYRFVQALADVRYQRRAIHLLCQPAHQNYQNKWPFRKYNRCIVMNFCNLPGFVGHRNPLRQTSRNSFVEFLPLQDRYHLIRTGGIHRFAFRDCLQQNSEAARGGGIVQALLKSFVVLHSALHVHSIR